MLNIIIGLTLGFVLGCTVRVVLPAAPNVVARLVCLTAIFIGGIFALFLFVLGWPFRAYAAWKARRRRQAIIRLAVAGGLAVAALSLAASLRQRTQ